MFLDPDLFLSDDDIDFEEEESLSDILAENDIVIPHYLDSDNS